MPKTDVKAAHDGPWGPAGTQFQIELDDGESKTSVKNKIERATGLPAGAQKLMLGAFSQLVVADKRAPGLRFGTCGTTEGMGLAYEVRVHTVSAAARLTPAQAAKSGVKAHVPPPTANRLDNLGNWGAGDHD